MTAKEYLQQVKMKDSEIENLKYDIQQLREMAALPGGISYGDKVQTSRNNDKFGTLYSRIDEKERKIVEKIDELVDFKLKVSEEINALSDVRYINILHRRHIKFQSWGTIASDMSYNIRYVQRLYDKALIAFEEKYADMLAECEAVI
ncbi:MAG: hypothetical protein Q4C58_10365 [Eubacteriales bacterium]|nr:hypothetical protein [Eubacteriales bacterium]